MNKEAIMREALVAIGELPLEFNTRARAIAQRAINQVGSHNWAAPLAEAQIGNTVDRGGLLPAGAPQEEAMEHPETYQPPEIEMIPVESSNIESVGHDGNKTLRIQFKSGHPYDYVGVEEEEFLNLLNAESIGRAWRSVVAGKDIKGIKLPKTEAED